MTENSAATEDTFSPDVSTTRNDELHRYELHVGDKLAVQIRFIDEPGHVDFIHTDTAEQFQGQGLGKVLAHFALDDVVASGRGSFRTAPLCTDICASTTPTPQVDSTGRSSRRPEPEPVPARTGRAQRRAGL